jgi:6-phosphogluconolactonase
MKKPTPPVKGPAQKIRWHVRENPAAVAAEACRIILEAAEEAITARGRFRIVLAGGQTPEKTYELLAEAAANWSLWEIYFGDERCLPLDDPSRNSLMAHRTWLGKVPLSEENVHPIQGELGAATAALLYQERLKNVLPFDLVVLGLGEDGHTASLFPGRHRPITELVYPVFDAPKPPAERVTLSVEALSQTRLLMVLVCGEEKRQAVADWRQGKKLPVSFLHPPCPLDVLLDQSAEGMIY